MWKKERKQGKEAPLEYGDVSSQLTPVFQGIPDPIKQVHMCVSRSYHSTVVNQQLIQLTWNRGEESINQTWFTRPLGGYEVWLNTVKGRRTFLHHGNVWNRCHIKKQSPRQAHVFLIHVWSLFYPKSALTGCRVLHWENLHHINRK